MPDRSNYELCDRCATLAAAAAAAEKAAAGRARGEGASHDARWVRRVESNHIHIKLFIILGTFFYKLLTIIQNQCSNFQIFQDFSCYCLQRVFLMSAY